MSRLPIEIKEKGALLRKSGYSIKEIAQKLRISQSTSSLWCRGIALDQKAQVRLARRQLLGYYKMSKKWERKRGHEEKINRAQANAILNKTRQDSTHAKLYCALLYWCEGEKWKGKKIGFVNSDPILIQTFLTLFRSAFDLDEKKFRVLMHLHTYHNEKQQKKFWSEITNIPSGQFTKTFHKHNTQKRIRENYPGCIRIAYNDVQVAKELNMLYKVFGERFGGVR